MLTIILSFCATQVNVGPYKESNIRAYGPGLEEGIANKPADFVVETNGETGALGFAIEGKSYGYGELSACTHVLWP